MAEVSTNASSQNQDEAQRRRRIAWLLHKAIVESSAVAAVEAGAPEPPPPTDASSSRDDSSAAARVIGFLQVIGEASPACIRESLGLSRSSSFRVLQSLAHSRVITTHGRTRNLVYRLNEQAPPPEQVALN